MEKISEQAIEPIRKQLTLDDVKDVKYIPLRIGDNITINMEKIERAKAKPDFCLSGVEYRYELFDYSGAVLTVSSWALWNVIRKCLNEVGRVRDIKLNIAHRGTKDYTCEVFSA